MTTAAETTAAGGRTPTDDELRGMDWWNALSEPARGYWLNAARARADQARLAHVSVADAWAEYKRTTELRCTRCEWTGAYQEAEQDQSVARQGALCPRCWSMLEPL